MFERHVLSAALQLLYAESFGVPERDWSERDWSNHCRERRVWRDPDGRE
jgi:hypothetical protein